MKTLEAILAHIDALEKRETAAKEALRFYGDEENYKEQPENWPPIAFKEKGQKARDTLRMMEEGK